MLDSIKVENNNSHFEKT